MIITCGQCQAKFQVAPEQIKVTGSKVRCSHCGYVFTVYRPAGPEPGTAARPARPEPGPGTGGRPEKPETEARPENAINYLRSEDLDSPQARREIRRLLYADNEEEEDYDDESWAEAGLDEATGRPPLRRRLTPSAPAPAQPQTEQSRTEQPPESEDAWDEGPEDSDLPEPDEVDDDLGLAADPTRPGQTRRTSA
ncbi:MAG: zinc-ribbon domain-containing protein, partial [Candidatus Adiutrix sp.]|nr:zinc-ribbon domain-containing protein [Candidatus Adiutrix sp.]